tara:strand:- start:8283 stop:9326 length:1044 start_codon:yes stop_codon:yes gene_type:complete
MRVILHIGSNKTGTTALQKTFSKNYDALYGAGILYPVAGRGSSIRQIGLRAALTPPDIALSGYASRVGAGIGREEYAKTFIEEFDRELSEFSGDTVILSDESLFIYAASQPFHAISQFLRERFSKLTVVCYLRRPDEYLQSEYSQHIKVGGRQTVRKRITQMTSDALYEEKLYLARDHLDDRPVIRCYDKARFKNGNIIDDFADAAGIVFPDLETPGMKNRSLSNDGIRILRTLNRQYGRDRPEILRRLTEKFLCDGPRFHLKLGARKRIFESVKDEHQRILDAFFEGDESSLYRIEDMLEPRQVAATDPNLHKRVTNLIIALHDQMSEESFRGMLMKEDLSKSDHP